MNKAAFYQSVRSTLFGGKLTPEQVQGMEGLLEAFDQVGDQDQDTLAYGMGTAYHETGGRMAPVREGFAKSDAGARRAVKKLAEKRGTKSAVAKYSQPAGPYGHVYYGRGHAQLTWLENYLSSSKDAGVDLVKNPDAMLDPVISARVLFRGIMDGRWNGQGKGLSHYEGADDFLDYAEAAAARRTVNVQDKAVLIAGYHRKFYDALSRAGWSPSRESPQKPAQTAGANTPVGSPTPAQPTPQPKAGGPLAAIFRWLISMINLIKKGRKK